jgi:PAS domain S-box-containing protein
MKRQENHEELINGIYGEYKAILENSGQSVYIYLDDSHKFCNKRFAALLGYKSPEEWSGISENFLQTFVADDSQEMLSRAYEAAIKSHNSSAIKITWKKKSGKPVDAHVIIVPIAYQGHEFALHFIY